MTDNNKELTELLKTKEGREELRKMLEASEATHKPAGVDIGGGVEMDPLLVTEAFWAEVTGQDAPPAEVANQPKTGVSFFEAAAFCNLRSAREGHQRVYAFGDSDGWGDDLDDRDILASDSWEGVLVYECADADGYRLPTEAEWEMAARDGQEDGELDFYGDPNEIAVFNRSEVCDVGTMKPTSKGLFDLWGLVYEWTGSKP